MTFIPRRLAILVTGLVAGATLLAAATAQAEEISNTQSALAYFNRLDQQKTGSFTLADMQRIESKEFKRTDENRDGKLSLEEYVYGIPEDREDVIERYTRRFELSDENQDGFVSLDEYMLFCVRVVNLADANKDGMVTKEEFMAVAGGDGK